MNNRRRPGYVISRFSILTMGGPVRGWGGRSWRRGRASSSRRVYGCRGSSRMRSVSPFFHHQAAFHDERGAGEPGHQGQGCMARLQHSHGRAVLPDTGLINSSSTSFWTRASRAVVGSSAMIRAGLSNMAPAIMHRWRMPPENSWGVPAQSAFRIGDADAFPGWRRSAFSVPRTKTGCAGPGLRRAGGRCSGPG